MFGDFGDDPIPPSKYSRIIILPIQFPSKNRTQIPIWPWSKSWSRKSNMYIKKYFRL